MPFDTHSPNVWSHQILTAVLIWHCYQSSLCVHFIICALALDKSYAVCNAIQPSIMYFAQKANKLAAIAVDCKYITACGLMIASILPSYVCSSDSIPSLFCAYQHLNGIHQATQNIHIYPSLECFWAMYNIKPLGSKIQCGLWLVVGMSHKAWSMCYLLQLGGLEQTHSLYRIICCKSQIIRSLFQWQSIWGRWRRQKRHRLLSFDSNLSYWIAHSYSVIHVVASHFFPFAFHIPWKR